MIVEKLKSDLEKAQKTGDVVRVATLRLLINELNNAEISLRSQNEPLTDDKALYVISKEAKKRLESIEMYKKANRYDLVDEESAELKIIKEYLPEQMSEDKIRAIITQTIKSLPEPASKNFGLVMRNVMQEVKGKADGRLVARLVKEQIA